MSSCPCLARRRVKTDELSFPKQRIYIVASDQSQSQYRILKIDRHYSPTDAHHELNIIEDGMVYTKAEVNSVIEMIGDGNKTVGGCQMVIPMFYGM